MGMFDYIHCDENAEPGQADEFWRDWREYRTRFRDGKLETIVRLTKVLMAV